MSELQSIDLFIFGTKITLYSDKPDEVKALAAELDEKINSLVGQYLGTEPKIILTLACLKALEENKKLKEELLKLSVEREKLDMTLQGFFYSID